MNDIKGCTECFYYKCGKISKKGNKKPDKCDARFSKRLKKWLEENKNKVKGKDTFTEMKCFREISDNPIIRFLERIL